MHREMLMGVINLFLFCVCEGCKDCWAEADPISPRMWGAAQRTSSQWSPGAAVPQFPTLAAAEAPRERAETLGRTGGHEKGITASPHPRLPSPLSFSPGP